MSFVGILGILIVFGLIIVFHEFGHFVVAKLTGMGVHEFSIGFGPTLLQKKVRDTTYSLRMVPLGGYVRIAGMELDDSEEERQAPNSFNKKPFLAKFATILAGATMNMVLALLVFVIIGMAIGYPLPGKKVFIGGTQPLSPAAKAGLQPGDLIVDVNGHQNPSIVEVQNQIRHGTPPVKMIVERDGKQIALTIQPKKIPSAERRGLIYHMTEYYGIGIQIEQSSGGWKRLNSVESIATGFHLVVDRIVDAFAQFVSLITGNINWKQLSGPVAIIKISYDTSQGAVISRAGLMNFFGMIGFLSVFIGFFNLLPIPALDGSRLLFLTIEAIIRRPFDRRKEALVHFVGLILLMALVLVITVKDIFMLAGK